VEDEGNNDVSNFLGLTTWRSLAFPDGDIKVEMMSPPPVSSPFCRD
jgi:hypothetical protein